MTKSEDKELQSKREELARVEQEMEAIRASWPADVEIDGLKLVCTCGACPEQYDVFDASGQQVGYLRLRHGYFRADVPECCGETVYEAEPRGDGIFETDERAGYLSAAVAAIKAHIQKGQKQPEDQ